MATIDLTSGATTLTPSRWANVKTPYLVEVTVDLAAAVTEKGSALAASDVIQAMELPVEHMVLRAGFEVTAVMTGTSTDATLDLGTAADADAYVDGFDLDAASAGDHAAVTATAPLIVGGTADTLDITIATQTGTITGGTLRVYALLLDVSDKTGGSLAALGS